MSTVDTKKDPKVIKTEVTDLAALIKKEITLDAKTGVASVPADLYERMLPTGLTKTIIEDLQSFNSRFAAAGTLANGEIGLTAMKKDKELNRVELSVPTVGKDRFNFSFDRSRQVPDRDAAAGTGGTKTKYGSSSAEFEMYGTKARGELVKVKQHLAEKALASFGS